MTYEVTHPAGAPGPAVPVEHSVHDGVGARVGAREQPHRLLDGRVQTPQRVLVDPVPGVERIEGFISRKEYLHSSVTKIQDANKTPT